MHQRPKTPSRPLPVHGQSNKPPVRSVRFSTALQNHAFRGRFKAVLLPLAFLVIFGAVLLSHVTLLRLPYFWDEGGYYVPAALDFYRTWTLIPTFTNAHPPLPNVILGGIWHLFGFHILVTRLVACMFASLGLTAVFSLGKTLLGSAPAWVLVALTALYPIWFAQSSLAHADVFAAAFTLSALSLYFSLPSLLNSTTAESSSPRQVIACSICFCFSVLAKETAIVQPVALTVLEVYLAYRMRRARESRNRHLVRALILSLPLPLLAGWYGYHYMKTGFIFGNPAYLRYNAIETFTVQHIVYALRIRFVHLVWQRQLWVPLALAGATLLLPSHSRSHADRILGLPRRVVLGLAILICANWVAFSVLGGALLTRYLLPIYPLLLLLTVAVWKDRTRLWLGPAVLTAASFLTALWVNPDTFFAPEDNLTYRNMIVVQQQAIDYLNQHFPDATVLTAWPVSADLTRPELGYTSRKFRVFSIENFSRPELAKAAERAGDYDTAVIFTTHYTSPSFRTFLLTNPTSWRGRRYRAEIDLAPTQVGALLGGEVVWQTDRYGEWAAVLRFPRTYDAQLLGAGPAFRHP